MNKNPTMCWVDGYGPLRLRLTRRQFLATAALAACSLPTAAPAHPPLPLSL